jgi:hypothetical protein
LPKLIFFLHEDLVRELQISGFCEKVAHWMDGLEEELLRQAVASFKGIQPQAKVCFFVTNMSSSSQKDSYSLSLHTALFRSLHRQARRAFNLCCCGGTIDLP